MNTEQKLQVARQALEKALRSIPCNDGAGGFIIEHAPVDGVHGGGMEQINPVDVVQMLDQAMNAALSAINAPSTEQPDFMPKYQVFSSDIGDWYDVGKEQFERANPAYRRVVQSGGTEQPAVCDSCKGSGLECVGYSGLDSDGNAPLLEPCSQCGYAEQPAAFIPPGYANEDDWLRQQLADAKASIKAHQAVLAERDQANAEQPARQALEQMQYEDGKVRKWYFDCEGHYIDVTMEAPGKYSILFRDRDRLGEGWLDQTEQPAGASVDGPEFRDHLRRMRADMGRTEPTDVPVWEMVNFVNAWGAQQREAGRNEANENGLSHVLRANNEPAAAEKERDELRGQLAYAQQAATAEAKLADEWREKALARPADLAGLHRYDIGECGPCFAPNDGSYVLFDDVQALLAGKEGGGE